MPVFEENEGRKNDLWSVLSELAARLGEQDALLAPNRAPLSFAGLRSRIAAAKEDLNRLGIGRGERVAIALPNGPEMAVCLLGGIACTIAAPLDPSCTKQEFRHYLGRLRPKALILPAASVTPAREVAEELGVRTIELVADLSAAAGTFTLTAAGAAPCPDASWNVAEDVGIILLTSGTTARQKLVPLKPRNLVAYARGINAIFRLGPGDRSLLLMPLFHGAGLKSSFLIPLLNGAAVVCLPRFDVASFFRHLDLFRPTWLTAGYALHHAILEGASAHRDVIGRARLRFIRSGTGRLDPEVKSGLERTFGAPVIEQYSSSETGVITCSPLPPEPGKPGTVGRPVINEVSIMAPDGTILGKGEEGEIVVRGPSVFAGYLDDPQANRAAFIDGWYRTGDLGRLDVDGFLAITGRTKDVINRGGKKISPPEVEAVLAGHGAIRDIRVFGVAHPSLGQEVVAAAVVREGTSVNEADLKAFAAVRLGDFKVPRRIFFREAFPLGASRKLDLRRLVHECELLLQAERSASALAPGRPLSPTEEAVHELWCQALGKERVGVDEDFFLLGGDSLKAVELLLSIEQRLDVEIPPGAMYGEGATVSRLAATVDRLRARPGLAGQPEAASADAAPAARSSRRARAALHPQDLVTLATLFALAPVAWLLPRQAWPMVCRALAKAHAALKGLPAKGLDEALARLEVPLTPAEMQRQFLFGVYEDIIMTLREHLPLAWRPAIRLHGTEHIRAARAAGRGAVLWSCPSPGGGLISKKALKAAGVDVVNLRSAIHPYSGSRFGMQLLNQLRTRVEDRYLADTVTLRGPDGLAAFQALRAHLEANTVISIAANGSEGTPFELPFLGGTLKLSLGAPTLAALHGAPLLPVFTAADGGGGFEVVVGPPVEARSGGYAGETARELARGYVGILEAHLRQHPADWRGWFMSHTWSPSAVATCAAARPVRRHTSTSAGAG